MKLYSSYLFLFFFLIASCNQNKTLKENIIQQDISENWEFKSTENPVWLKATVPGTVHTDLMNNGNIKDPFYRTNEKYLQWIDKKDWEYRTVFSVDSSLLDKKEVKLIFEGLDTYATVYLNNHEILKADNMFRSWEVSVKDYLVLGWNVLSIDFHSPINIGLEKLAANGYPLPASNDQSENGELADKKVSIFSRKAGYHYGWDWGPRLVSSGIWRPVKLMAYDYGKIENVHIILNELNENKAMMEAVVEIYAAADNDFEFSIFVSGEKKHSEKQKVSAGKSKYRFNFKIDDPELWWPNGLGEQHLYDIELRIEKEGIALVDSKKLKTGLRTIELVQEPDSTGKSFYFKINGHPVFAKGANYIPNDVFLTRFKPDDYERIILDAAEANMNMLRVWGGGIYENDIFYELCDKYGIMVWQDFMYACSMYPGSDDFLNNARIEAEENIIRLRNHPSLALWCGNNEIEVAWGEYEEGRGWGWKERYTDEQRKEIWHNYDTLFHHILPQAVKQYNPQIDYWHSSPSAEMGKLASHTNTSGDMHYWGVWHGQEPFSDFRKYKARFMSEYGFQSFPELNTVKTYALPKEWDIESEVMAHHQRSGIGNLRIRQYMEEDYIIPDDFEEFLYVSQLLQAEGIKMAIESHRAERPYCMGTLYWQLNDCWPVASWSGIDYYGRWKAMHHFVKKAFQETIIASFQDESNIELWAITDYMEEREARIDLQLMDFNGNSIWEESLDLNLKANASEKIKQIPLKSIKSFGNTSEMFLLTRLYAEDEMLAEDIHYFVKPKHLELKSIKPEIKVIAKKGYVDISLAAQSLTKNVFLSTSLSTDHFSDNFFDLLPGETTYISFPGEYNPVTFFDSLHVMYLFDTEKEPVVDTAVLINMFKHQKDQYYHTFWHGEFEDMYSQLNHLFNKYSKYNIPEISKGLEEVRKRSGGIAGRDNFRKGIIYKLESGEVLPILEEPIIYGLIRYYYRHAEVDSVLHFDKLFSLKFTDSKRIDDEYKNNITRSKEVKEALITLENLNYAEDKYLWKKAEICKKLAATDWLCGEGGCNPEVYFQFYREILEKYPESEYADDAEYHLISYYESASHEGGDQYANLHYIEEYNLFIEKYPDSKHIPDVLYNLASLYSNAEISWDSLYDFNIKALEIYDRIKNEFPDYENQYIDYSINYVNKNLPILALKLSIASDKQIYQPGEPVSISFTFRNTYSEAQSVNIKGKGTIPMAFLEITKVNQSGPLDWADFEKIDSHEEAPATTIILKPGDQYVESWDITYSALQGLSGSYWKYELGRFKFNIGKYKIKAHMPIEALIGYRLHSEPIYIEIQ